MANNSNDDYQYKKLIEKQPNETGGKTNWNADFRKDIVPPK